MRGAGTPAQFPARVGPARLTEAWIRFATFALALALCAPAARATELGANYNQYLPDVYNGALARAGVRWVRGFVNVQRNYLTFDAPNRSVITGVLEANIAQQGDRVSGSADILAVQAVDKLIEVKGMKVRGERLKTILSLKTDFKVGCVEDKPAACAGVPAVGTREMRDLVTAIHDRLLANNLGAWVDIVVVGNEPMFETPVADAARYGEFLDLLVAELVKLRADQGWGFRIFAGALNKASTLKHDPILEAVIDVVNRNPHVDGLDMHLHVDSIGEADADLDFVRNAKGVTKDIITTEFSLVGLWTQKAEDRLGYWGEVRGYPQDTTFRDWLNLLLMRAGDGHPVPPAEFMSFFRSRYWYTEQWFADFFAVLERHRLLAATYGLQSTPVVPPLQYKPHALLWVVNFVWNGSLFGLGPDGFYVDNPIVAPEFARIAKKQWPQ